MKRLFLFARILLFIGILSCEKKEETTTPGELPTWVKQKAEELSAKKGDSCKYIWVLIYEAQGKYYYNIDFAYSSCSNCNLFDSKGNQVAQSELAKLPDLKVTDAKPACP
jgi:hypothetical protein